MSSPAPLSGRRVASQRDRTRDRGDDASRRRARSRPAGDDSTAHSAADACRLAPCIGRASDDARAGDLDSRRGRNAAASSSPRAIHAAQNRACGAFVSVATVRARRAEQTSTWSCFGGAAADAQRRTVARVSSASAGTAASRGRRAARSTFRTVADAPTRVQARLARVAARSRKRGSPKPARNDRFDVRPMAGVEPGVRDASVRGRTSARGPVSSGCRRSASTCRRLRKPPRRHPSAGQLLSCARSAHRLAHSAESAVAAGAVADCGPALWRGAARTGNACRDQEHRRRLAGDWPRHRAIRRRCWGARQAGLPAPVVFASGGTLKEARARFGARLHRRDPPAASRPHQRCRRGKKPPGDQRLPICIRKMRSLRVRIRDRAVN